MNELILGWRWLVELTTEIARDNADRAAAMFRGLYDRLVHGG
jgi:hypothetical protein